ncbi:MAG: GDSL-type esterase/lipase family protein [Planctomycetota bacterium]
MTSPSLAPRPRRRRFLFLVWALVGSLLLLELVLQASSLVVWLLQPAPAQPTIESGQSIVCVGDSWTHGIGASDASTTSYPAVLQELLRARTGQPWTVANCGQSGQNSRDVLERLPGQLQEYRPRLLCVLVGQNDFWSRPELVADAAEIATVDHRSYRFRWRLPRLFAWVAGKFTGAGQAGVAAAPGSARSGEAWQKRPFKEENPYWKSEPADWPWSAERQRLKDEGWRLEAAKDLPAALDMFSKALAQTPEDAQCHQMSASLLRRMGRDAESKSHLDWLRDTYQKRRSFWSGTALAWALEACGQRQETRDVVVSLLERFPNDGSLWRLRAQSEFLLGLHDDAERSIAKAIASSRNPWNHYVAFQVAFLGRHDPAAAARAMFDGYVTFNDAQFLEGAMVAMGSPDAVRKARAAVDAYECAPDVRARLAQILDDALLALDGDAAGKVLEAHLTRIIAMARDAGARPVLLCYPVIQKAEDHLRRAALANRTPFVEVHTLFDARRGPRPWQEFRAPDGHCNDAGYRLMAEIVTDGLLPILDGNGK